MPIIKPISDLRNNFGAISKLCHKEGEPVFITKNGVGNLVVMSIAKYEQMDAQLDLYRKLSVAEYESSIGADQITHQDMMKQIRKKINAKNI